MMMPWQTFKGRASGMVFEKVEALEFGADGGLPVYSIAIAGNNGYRIRVPNMPGDEWERLALRDEVEISRNGDDWEVIIVLSVEKKP